MPSAPFYVKDNKGNLVAAQFLLENGVNIRDPNIENARQIHIYTAAGDEITNGNPNGFVVAPFGYSLDRARAYGEAANDRLLNPDGLGTIDAYAMMFFAFKRGGPEDLQRAYNDINGNPVPDGNVVSFQDIASIHYGATAAAAGLSRQDALYYGGLYNAKLSDGTITTGEAGNNPLNAESIPFGWGLINGPPVAAQATGLAIAVDSAQVANVLGRPFDGTMADAIRLTDAIADGELQINGGFVDALTNERYKATFDTALNKVVISVGEDGLAVSTVSAGFLQHITALPVDGMRIDTAFAP